MEPGRVEPKAEITIRVYRDKTGRWETIGGKRGNRLNKLWNCVVDSVNECYHKYHDLFYRLGRRNGHSG